MEIENQIENCEVHFQLGCKVCKRGFVLTNSYTCRGKVYLKTFIKPN